MNAMAMFIHAGDAANFISIDKKYFAIQSVHPRDRCRVMISADAINVDKTCLIQDIIHRWFSE